MRSIQYECTLRGILRIVLPMLIALACIVTLLKVAQREGWLPRPAIAVEPDTTVLAHQVRAARKGPAADIILVGDSTCLVGVDANALSRQIPGQPRVLSLALFIWMDLASYGQMVEEYAAAHPGQPRCVVLLVSPAKLASASKDPGGDVSDILSGATSIDETGANNRRSDWLGAGALRRHVLSHCLATPLHGSGAAFFGFSSGIEDYMTEHHGSLITFGVSVIPPGATRSAWTLAPEFERESREFKSRLPTGTRLCIGLTPGPSGTAAGGSWREDLLAGWNRWLAADVLLTNLPAALPDVYFSDGGHLNENGQRRFTALLARELSGSVPKR